MANSGEWAEAKELVRLLDQHFRANREVIEAGLRKFVEILQSAAVAINANGGVRAVLYPHLRTVVKPLAMRGWFVSGYFGLSEVTTLAEECESMSEAELDSVVGAMYRSSLDEHGADLIRDYPQRAFAIKPAIDAHNRGEYALSVPLFYAQAEGISIDVIDKDIFSHVKRPGGIDGNIKAAAREWLERAEYAPYDTLAVFMEIMWLPFEDPFPVGYGAKDRQKHQYEGLNRNTIMHGMDLTYATEENSLKAFSMLSHVASLLHDPVRPD